MVVDGSDSITASEWATIKEAIARAVNVTLSHDGSIELTVVQFGYSPAKGYARTEIPPVVVVGGNHASIAKMIMEMPKGDSGTPIPHGIFLGWKEIRNSPNFAAERQVINLATDELPNVRNHNATSDLDGNGKNDARDDMIAVVNEAVAQGLDELDIEGIGLSESSREWLRSWAVRPQPGIPAPPFTKPGWIRIVSSPAEFANTMGQKFEAITDVNSLWAPTLEGALAAGLLTVGVTSVLSSLASVVNSPESFPSGSFAQRIRDLFPDTLKEWLQNFISSRRKLVVERKDIPIFILTKTEAISFAAALSILTFAFSYAKAGSLDEMLSIIPLVLATSIVIEFVKSLAVELVARSQGVWSEYRLWYFGLTTFLFSSLAFKAPFSSPSRVCHHSPRFTSRSQGFVAVTGVAIALVFAALFYELMAGGFGLIGNMGVVMCLTMAFFDSIPISPMNGKDIYDWSRFLWVSVFTSTLSLYLLCLLTL
jgi:hypothetical protein